MATERTEYKPNLTEAVDILLYGPPQARQAESPSLTARLRSWATTPLRRFLLGQAPQAESPGEGDNPISGLSAGRRFGIRTQTYQMYNELLSLNEARSPNNSPGNFEFDIHLENRIEPVLVGIMRFQKKDPVLDIELIEGQPGNSRMTGITFGPDDYPSIKRSYEGWGELRSSELNPYSPTLDVLALKTLGEYAREQQKLRIIEEALDHETQ